MQIRSATLPEPDIPLLQVSLLQVSLLQVSLLRGLHPEVHIDLGAALAPLRDEGVVFVGSGMSYHNMRGFFRGDARAHGRLFDAWLEETSRLRSDEAAPGARLMGVGEGGGHVRRCNGRPCSVVHRSENPRRDGERDPVRLERGSKLPQRSSRPPLRASGG